MQLADETAPLDEVAQAIGRTPEWLKRHWLALHRRSGFPRKISGGGFVWPRRAVAAWLRAGGAEPATIAPANQNDAAGDLVAAAAKSLDQRYGVTR